MKEGRGRTHVYRARLGELEPEADAQPGGGDAPDDVAPEHDDEERHEVSGHDDCEAGPGVPCGVVCWRAAWFGGVVP